LKSGGAEIDQEALVRTSKRLVRLTWRLIMSEICSAVRIAGQPSQEYGAFIIHAIETGQPRVIYGNVINGWADR
jgi:alpha-galactosidase/6-phospho-beta-glucosidase family protein